MRIDAAARPDRHHEPEARRHHLRVGLLEGDGAGGDGRRTREATDRVSHVALRRHPEHEDGRVHQHEPGPVEAGVHHQVAGDRDPCLVGSAQRGVRALGASRDRWDADDRQRHHDGQPATPQSARTVTRPHHEPQTRHCRWWAPEARTRMTRDPEGTRIRKVHHPWTGRCRGGCLLAPGGRRYGIDSSKRR